MDQPSPTQQTEPQPEPPTFAEQENAVAALADMAAAFPHLPPAFVTVHKPPAVHLAVQLSTQTAFERWREALRIPPSAVELVSNGRDSWLSADGSFSGSAVHLTGWGIPTCYPREAATDDGRQAEQRHHLDEAGVLVAALAPAGGAL